MVLVLRNDVIILINRPSIVDNRRENKAKTKSKMLIGEYRPELLEYESAKDTIINVSGLSNESVAKLSKTFMEIEDELQNGCSRQLIINALVFLEAINTDRAETFLRDAGYISEVRQINIMNSENPCCVVAP